MPYPTADLRGGSAGAGSDVVGTDRLGNVHTRGLDRSGNGRRAMRTAHGMDRAHQRNDCGCNEQPDDEETSHVDLHVVTPGWRPPLPRASDSLITEVWPTVSDQLLSYLRSLRVRPDLAEDIVQEVAARIVGRRVQFSSVEDLRPWAMKVAKNLAIDAWRSDRHLAGAPEQFDCPAPLDVSAQAEDRVVLDAVRGAMPRLSAADRDAIIAGLVPDESASRKESVKMAVRRFRARTRLSAMLGGVAAYIAILLRRLRDSPARMALVGAVAVLALDCGAVLHHLEPEPSSAPAERSVTASPGEQPRVPVLLAANVAPLPATSDERPAAAPPVTTSARRAARPQEDRPIVSSPRETLQVYTPVSDRPTRVDTRPRQEDDHLLCVGYGALVPKTCVG